MPSSKHSSILERLGFRLTSTCQCGRTLTERWQRDKPLVLITVKPHKDHFRIRSVYPNVKGTLAQLEGHTKATIAKELAR